MTTTTTGKHPAEAGDVAKIGASASIKTRRRFVLGLGAIVPAILTVGSRSALASNCLSPSANASINLLHSRPDRAVDGSCAGRGPGHWKKHKFDLAATTRFDTVFSGGFPGKSMKDVTALTGNDNFEALGRHLAAAWCNLHSGMVTPNVLNVSDLRAMWNGRYGTYTAVAGVTWGEVDIVNYLKTTMI